MKIYISIPMTGHDLATQKAKAVEIAEKIKALGHEPVNPFDTPEPPAGLSDKEKYAYYMGEDIKRLLMCDAIFMCEGWFTSCGCRTEHYIAKCYGKEVFENLVQIPDLNLLNGNYTILVFPKVKSYRFATPKKILLKGAKCIGKGVVYETDVDKRYCRLKFSGEGLNIEKPVPIALFDEERGKMLMMIKSTITIDGSEAVIKWWETPNRKRLTEWIIFYNVKEIIE